MKAIDNETRWAKIGQIDASAFLGKETIFFCSGCHIVFVNLTTQEELIYTANNARSGDGVAAIAGHRTLNIFAFAEKRTKPSIFIKTYPNLEELFVLRDGESRGYLQIAFSESSLFVTIGDLPEFVVTVWNWRLGVKIASKPGGVLETQQAIRCNLSSPVLLAQFATRKKLLHVWDVFICGKKTVLTDHTVNIGEECGVVMGVLWTTEGGLFVLDQNGSIFVLLPDYRLEKVVDFTVGGSHKTSFAWYKFGIVVAGPNNEIRHYKKSGTWSIDWSLTPQEPISQIFARFEYLVALTDNNDILQVLSNQKEFRAIRHRQSKFRDLCLIYPCGVYILVLCYSSFLNLFEVATGNTVSSLDVDAEVLVLKENPVFPYVALGLSNGWVKLISAFKPTNLALLAQFHLSDEPINSIAFSDCGTAFIAASLHCGTFFIIEGIPGGEMKIIEIVDARRQIASFMMVLSQDCYRIFAVPVTSNSVLAGDVVLRFCITKNKAVDVREYNFDEPIFYKQIVASVGPNRDRIFYGVPFYSKLLHQIEIKKGETRAIVTNRIPTGHQMQDLHFFLNANFAVTWAFDGFIIARSSTFAQNVGIVLPHHCYQGGVQKACLDPYQKHIISLGRDNVLVCTNLMANGFDFELKKNLELLLNSSNYKIMFQKQTNGFDREKSYLKILNEQFLEKEQKECQVEKTAILEEFTLIQNELQGLLTENLEGPDNEKLDLEEFNLNLKLFEEKREENKKLLKATEIYLKNLIDAHNIISEYMMENFWQKMKIPGCTIKAIFANFEVDNFVLLPEDDNEENKLNWIKKYLEMTRGLEEGNVFHPWKPMPEGDVLKLISSPAAYENKNIKTEVLKNIESDQEILKLVDDLDTKIAFSGANLGLYIQPGNRQYLQEELLTYYQTELQWRILKNDSNRLKTFFNTNFDKTMTQKLQEMSNIKEKNDRLRHIVSELNYFSDEKITVNIEDPIWDQVETPETITQVKDEEVLVLPYVSRSEQTRLDAKAAEAERLRLLLLADDFRERALMSMMNGVLEVRWEDELKKDVPLPKCMLENEPEQFNEEDLKVMRRYNEDVTLLNSERQRYKHLLVAEYEKVAKNTRETIKKFNGKLSDLLLLKLSVDSALGQESLKIARNKLFQHKKQIIDQKEKGIVKNILHKEEEVKSIQTLLASLHDAAQDIRTYLESFQIKDKFLEKGFKKDIQDMSLVVQEQALKLYKKRPKITIRSFNSATILSELTKCLAPNAKVPIFLGQDAADFIRQLDHLDLYIGVPAIVDEHTYFLICRHRRLRIEYEMKLKEAQCELTEAENTISTFQKRLTQKKDDVQKKVADLEVLKKEFLDLLCNKEIQIVMPRGLVEIPLTGSFEDFEDAVMICRDRVEEINNIILNQGAKKIKALTQSMTFRRKILAMEWDHKKMKMLIQDLEEKLNDIQEVKLTKELQTYLKSKDKDKTILFETEIDMVKASYENTIQDRKDKVKRMKKQIKMVQKNDKDDVKKIQEYNVDVCELNLKKDKELDEKEKMIIDERMKILLKRSKLVQQIQDNHHEILMVQTELEILRLKTFPTLKYKVVN